MAGRAERLFTGAVARLGRQRFADRISGQAAEYWSGPDRGAHWNANSHWRDGLGDDAWFEVGRDHWDIYSRFARALGVTSPGVVIEWGAGGGANAVAFTPHADTFIAADISDESLAECRRQVEAVCGTEIETRRIDLTEPFGAASGLDDTCNTFVCVYVLELTAGPDQAVDILRIAEKILTPGGIAMVQIKYHTLEPWTRGRPGLRYDRNLASTTTFAIDEFWQLAASVGLRPELITLVPENRLDVRYAYFALRKPDRRTVDGPAAGAT